MTSREEVARYCGYNSAFDLLRDNMSQDELLDMLEEYIGEDKSGHIEDIVIEIATDKFDYIDYDAIEDAAMDAKYQEYKEKRQGIE